MNSKANFTSISYSRAIARHQGLQEKDIWQLLVGTKISADRFIYDDTPIDSDDQKIIFQNTLNLNQNLNYGLTLGETLAPPAHGTMGFLANCSPTLYTALEDFGKYLPTRVSFGHLNLSYDTQYVTCLMATAYEDDPLINKMVIEAFSISLKILIESVIGKAFTEGEVHFMYDKPKYWLEYQEHFKCKILFNQPSNKILIPINLKEYPNVSSDFSTYQVYKNLCQKQLGELNTDIYSTSDRVRKQLLLAPPGKSMNEESVAAAMFISKRTLSRRLKKEGTSFRRVSSEVMNSIARSYLRETDIPIENIANLLSYHDSSSFRRAFKRENTVSPQAYRNEHRKEFLANTEGRNGDG